MIWAIFYRLSGPLLVFFHPKCFLNPLGTFGTHLKDPGETLFSVGPWKFRVNQVGECMCPEVLTPSMTTSWADSLFKHSVAFLTHHHDVQKCFLISESAPITPNVPKKKKKKSVAFSARLLPTQCKDMQWIGKAQTALDTYDAPECMVKTKSRNNRLKKK